MALSVKTGNFGSGYTGGGLGELVFSTTQKGSNSQSMSFSGVNLSNMEFNNYCIIVKVKDTPPTSKNTVKSFIVNTAIYNNTIETITSITYVYNAPASSPNAVVTSGSLSYNSGLNLINIISGSTPITFDANTFYTLEIYKVF